jgi:catechol 1,2-dioxygenase
MTDNRARMLIEDLERTMQDFIRKHHITHDEYRKATEILVGTVRAGEESLLFDVFLEAAATDTDNLAKSGSVAAIEGPFYLPGAPLLEPPHVLPQRPDERGEVLFFSGTVTDATGTPLAGAELDMWQADAKGHYSNIHPDLPPFTLRGRFRTDADGAFEIRTILPPPYEIPKDGPTGIVLNTLGRHFFRPAHLHLKIRHPGHEELTSQLYFSGGEWLGSDVANAVRDELVLTLGRHDDPGDLASRGLSAPYLSARYDFALATA